MMHHYGWGSGSWLWICLLLLIDLALASVVAAWLVSYQRKAADARDARAILDEHYAHGEVEEAHHRRHTDLLPRASDPNPESPNGS